MRLSTHRMTCRSDRSGIRCIRRVYGHRIPLNALWIKGCRVQYTVYTVFCNIHLYIETYFFIFKGFEGKMRHALARA